MPVEISTVFFFCPVHLRRQSCCRQHDPLSDDGPGSVKYKPHKIQRPADFPLALFKIKLAHLVVVFQLQPETLTEKLFYFYNGCVQDFLTACEYDDVVHVSLQLRKSNSFRDQLVQWL